jgi:hypothetical protein
VTGFIKTPAEARQKRNCRKVPAARLLAGGADGAMIFGGAEMNHALGEPLLWTSRPFIARWLLVLERFDATETGWSVGDRAEVQRFEIPKRVAISHYATIITHKVPAARLTILRKERL